MNGFYGFWHKILAAPLRFVFNVKIKNPQDEPPIDSGAYLVCANHMSIGDAVWMCASFKHRQLHFMSKAELFKIPLIGWVLRKLGAYPVERGSADISSLRNTVSLLKQGFSVGMFPQGTRCKGKNPLETPVKSGIGIIAVRSGVSVLPVYIETKNFTPLPLRRKTVIIGKPIPYETIKSMHDARVDYRHISQFIFDNVCELGGFDRSNGLIEN